MVAVKLLHLHRLRLTGHSMQSFLFVVFLIIISFTSAFADDTAVQRLDRALQKLDNLAADFKQTVVNDDKVIVQQSRGKLATQRPGKFSWIYTDPYEQKILADGQQLWVYDVDLEQVTVRPIDTGLANAPIMILIQQHSIEETFNIHEIGQRKFLYWVELASKTNDMEYNRIYIGLQNDVIKAMELHDSFGQSTQIVFDNLRFNVLHNPAIFQFSPPPGVDVFAVDG